MVVSLAILRLRVLVSTSSNCSGYNISDCTGFSPSYSFNIVAMLLSMWVLHAAGVFQKRTNEGKLGLTFNILWTGIKVTSDETKGPVSLPYNGFYMKTPI